MRKITTSFITCFLSICASAQSNGSVAVTKINKPQAAAQISNAAAPAIVVQKTGTGIPVMFLPGFMSPGSVWQQTVDKLPEKMQAMTVSYAGFNGLAPIDTPWYPQLLRE